MSKQNALQSPASFAGVRQGLVLLGLCAFPFIASPFLTYQLGAQALILGLIALLWLS